MSFNKFNDEWIEWVNINLERGCDKDEIFDILLKNNYEFNKICKIMKYDKSKNNILENNPLFIKIKNKNIQLYKINNFLNNEECKKLIQIINTNLIKSQLTNKDEPDKKFRTSSTHFFNMNYSLVEYVNNKICNIMKISKNKCEKLQGQKYVIGEEFKEHLDYFSKDKEYNHLHLINGGQRTWTFMIYLNDVKEGGETEFTQIDITIKPKKGMALIWNNLNDNNNENIYTKHRGKPIITGEKYIITTWFRQEDIS